MRKKRFTFLFLSLAIGMQVMAGASLDLSGDWRITSLSGNAALSDTEAVMSFSEVGEFSAYVGCNRAAGSFKLDETGITFSPLAATRMMCPEEVMAQEDAFFNLMTQVMNYRVDGDSMFLLDGQGNALVEAQR